MRTSFFIALALICVLDVNAKIYRWTDENGVIHYGQQPPSLNQTDLVNPLTSSLTAAEPETKEDKLASSKTSEQAIIETKAKERNRTPINCSESVKYTQDSLNLLIANGKKSYNNGFIEKAEYEQAETLFSELKLTFSLAKCDNASGKERDFYLCVSDYKNHFLYCLDQYKAA